MINARRRIAMAVATCAALAATAGVASAEDQDFGHVAPADVLLDRRTVDIKWKLNPFYSKSVRFPSAGFYECPITAITVKDLRPNGDSGRVTLAAGGVGEKFTELKFKPHQLRGASYRVDIYVNPNCAA
ncbi:hypothetical protein KBZ94_27545 [Streptomyces sp. RM72]|uniref:MBF2 family protein n=1 Tax=Streptomyces sp. RM72 TaxID=1115510 RepID=UPI001B384681|nr:MBF2 family protein [Streptomyces sp. RM72]MBQ0888631.1 hypothetical protein [Streptomyces sp. RM72]